MLPQVLNGEAGGRGGAAEGVEGVVGCLSVVRARGVLGCPDPLAVGLQSVAMTGGHGWGGGGWSLLRRWAGQEPEGICCPPERLLM